ncbi:vWA domain-containing protein [Marinomonas ostreistagni]|uniref:vWA domain-containing protein n=1 Tax=Marinomonas ostreistagni TaxID=359209 RepID=UPI001951E0E7|nr:VWA domain-containing protein [Marinomonas ostreistagni]MBM6551938.1 VWA domain-containing protein [Marinomonas ostreistagni]
MTLFDSLHFTRPYWLLLLPISWLLITLVSVKTPDRALKNVVAEHLLPYMTGRTDTSPGHKWLGLISVNLFIIGLAGISFDQRPTDLYSPTNKTVFVVDQSLSLYATDVRPNRLTKAKQVLRDILNSDLEGDLALVAYAGDAYVVSPFTQDTSTLTHFLVALDPRIMPLYGSQLHQGLATALDLVAPVDYPYTTFVVLTDDLKSQDIKYLKDTFVATDIQLKIIAVGTAEGAPVSLPDGQMLRHQGQIISPKVPLDTIAQTAQDIGAEFFTTDLTPSQRAQLTRLNPAVDRAQKSDITGSTWREQGHWFALPFIVWLLWQFRSSALFMICLMVIMPYAPKSQASMWDWFKTNDQKAQQAADQSDWSKAAQLFEDPQWQAASDYALENYQGAAEKLQPLAHSAADFYNLGNSLALANDIEGAINAYQTALEQQPEFVEAQQNLDYLETLLAKQQNENDDGSSEQNSPNNDQQSDSGAQDQTQSNEDPQQSDDSNEQKQDNDTENADNQTSTSRSEDALSTQDIEQEERQALEQWLRQIQDDPGTLLQRKLWHLHQQRRNENRYNQEDGQQPW